MAIAAVFFARDDGGDVRVSHFEQVAIDKGADALGGQGLGVVGGEKFALGVGFRFGDSNAGASNRLFGGELRLANKGELRLVF